MATPHNPASNTRQTLAGAKNKKGGREENGDAIFEEKGTDDFFVDRGAKYYCLTKITDELIKENLLLVRDDGSGLQFAPDFNPNKEFARPLSTPYHNVGVLCELRVFILLIQ